MCFCLGSAVFYHLLATVRAIDIGVAVPLPTCLRVADVQYMAVLERFQMVGFVFIKPQPFTVGAAVNGNLPMSDFFHAVLAFGTLYAVYRCIIFHIEYPYYLIFSLSAL